MRPLYIKAPDKKEQNNSKDRNNLACISKTIIFKEKKNIRWQYVYSMCL